MKYVYSARLVSVTDGDSVVVDLDLGFGIWWRGVRIRLHGIDAPELKTAEGRAAASHLRHLIYSEEAADRLIVRTIKDRADKYGGRYLGVLSIEDRLLTLNEMMVRDGHAKPWDGKGSRP